MSGAPAVSFASTPDGWNGDQKSFCIEENLTREECLKRLQETEQALIATIQSRIDAMENPKDIATASAILNKIKSAGSPFKRNKSLLKLHKILAKAPEKRSGTFAALREKNKKSKETVVAATGNSSINGDNITQTGNKKSNSNDKKNKETEFSADLPEQKKDAPAQKKQDNPFDEAITAATATDKSLAICASYEKIKGVCPEKAGTQTASAAAAQSESSAAGQKAKSGLLDQIKKMFPDIGKMLTQSMSFGDISNILGQKASGHTQAAVTFCMPNHSPENNTKKKVEDCIKENNSLASTATALATQAAKAALKFKPPKVMGLQI